MHCPSCGQQQISNETKFCSRCGLPLGIVAELVAHGGFLPQLAELERNSETLYTRRNGVIFSLFWLIFWLPIMAVVFGGILDVDILGQLFSVVGIFGGLLIFLFSLFFLKKGSKSLRLGDVAPHQAAGLHAASALSALPPQQFQPVDQYRHAGAWRDTNDLQPTVTESTTQLLDQNDGER